MSSRFQIPRIGLLIPGLIPPLAGVQRGPQGTPGVTPQLTALQRFQPCPQCPLWQDRQASLRPVLWRMSGLTRSLRCPIMSRLSGLLASTVSPHPPFSSSLWPIPQFLKPFNIAFQNSCSVISFSSVLKTSTSCSQETTCFSSSLLKWWLSCLARLLQCQAWRWRQMSFLFPISFLSPRDQQKQLNPHP